MAKRLEYLFSSTKGLILVAIAMISLETAIFGMLSGPMAELGVRDFVIRVFRMDLVQAELHSGSVPQPRPHDIVHHRCASSTASTSTSRARRRGPGPQPALGLLDHVVQRAAHVLRQRFRDV